MITLQHLTIKRKNSTILDGVNLHVREADRIGIMGASGIGKSTLAFALLGEVGEGLKLVDGNLQYEHVDLLKNGKYMHPEQMRELRLSTGHLDQDPASSLNPKHRIHFILTELAGGRGEESASQVRETIQFFGLPYTDDFLRRYPHELSGGQRRRVALARILLRHPKLLILDEPTADLDSETRNDVLWLVSRLLEKMHPALLLISHDEEVIRTLATTCYTLEQGKLRPLPEKKRGDVQCDPASCPPKNRERKPIFQVSQLSVKAPGAAKAILNGLTFCLYEQEALAITGPSGVGKTTLIRALLGLWPRRAGSVRYEGKILADAFQDRSDQERALLGWVPQDPRTSFNPSVPLDRALRRIPAPSRSVDEVLRMVGLSEETIAGRFSDQLSGGQIQRLAIARAILEGAKILLLDEVTSSLDPQSRDAICDLLNSLKDRYSLLVVTHDPTVVKRLCDRELRLDKDAAVRGSVDSKK